MRDNNLTVSFLLTMLPLVFVIVLMAWLASTPAHHDCSHGYECAKQFCEPTDSECVDRFLD